MEAEAKKAPGLTEGRQGGTGTADDKVQSEIDGNTGVVEDSTSSSESSEQETDDKGEPGSESDSKSNSELARVEESGSDEDSASSSSSASESDSDSHAESDSPHSPTHDEPTHQPDLKSRLASFLPQLAAANQTLSHSERIDDVSDGEEQYIEMNLGLGVLSETPENGKAKGGEEEIRTRENEDDDESGEDGNGEDLLSVLVSNVKSDSGTKRDRKRKIEEIS